MGLPTILSFSPWKSVSVFGSPGHTSCKHFPLVDPDKPGLEECDLYFLYLSDPHTNPMSKKSASSSFLSREKTYPVPHKMKYDSGQKGGRKGTKVNRTVIRSDGVGFSWIGPC
jgi:hypothetical protein